MAKALPTVRVVNWKNPDADTWLTINQADYDPAQHTLWEERVTHPVATMRLVESPHEKVRDLRPSRGRRGKRVTVYGITYQSMADASKATGIPYRDIAALVDTLSDDEGLSDGA